MGRIDSISQALETEHGFDLSTGKIVNIEEYQLEKTLLPANVLKQISGDDDDDEEEESENSELVLYGDPSENNVILAGGTPDEDEIDEDYKKDEALVKENMRTLIDKSMDMADELIEIVRISESPKSFDSAANFLRAIAELNEKLLDVHDRKVKRKDAKKKNGSTPTAGSSTSPAVNNTQNNTIICKDPADILKMLNGKD